MANKRRRPGGRPPAETDLDVATRVMNDDAGMSGEGVEVRTHVNAWGESEAFFMPVKLRRASPLQRDLLRECQSVVRRHITVLAQLDDVVQRMRAAGLSWDSIGWCVGMSGAGARKRWGEESPT